MRIMRRVRTETVYILHDEWDEVEQGYQLSEAVKLFKPRYGEWKFVGITKDEAFVIIEYREDTMPALEAMVRWQKGNAHVS